MKTRTIVGIGVIALLAYLLLRKKKGVNLSDIKVDKNAPAPPTPTASLTVVKGDAPVNLKKSPVLIEDIRVPVKEPIYIAPINAIPNVYDRGVGQPLSIAANGRQESFYNMSGYCSENVQNACKCSAGKTGKYTLDIPQLP
jgi:hypothetical protein